MSENLKKVYDKANGDSQFARELLFDGPVSACEKVGIQLNRSEIKILGDAMRDIRLHFLEKLFVVTQGPDVLWNGACGNCIGEM